MSRVTVAPLRPLDRQRWGELYAAYARFYEVEQTEEMRERVWSWLVDSAHEVTGLGARIDGELVGIAHLRAFARPLAASSGLYLDDLFVDSAARGSGVGARLLEAARTLARENGHGVVRWITAQDNATARRLYDGVADTTEWVTYDMSPWCRGAWAQPKPSTAMAKACRSAA